MATNLNPSPPPRNPGWFRVETRAAMAEADKPAEPSAADVYLYDEIGGWGVQASDFVAQVDALDVDTIHLFLNSPGGAAWDGIAIMNALRRHKAKVEVTVDGLAASIASVIAMAGDKVTMNRGSEMMIHEAWGWAMGNAQDMSETAAILGKLSDSIADTYAARAGGTRETWRALMVAETWYTAEEAVKAKLADEWVDSPATKEASTPVNAFDMGKFGYSYANRAHAPSPILDPPKLPASEPGEPNRKENVAMSDILKAGLRERLGVTDAAVSDELLLAAVDEALAENATDTAAPAAAPGTVLIDATVLADLQASAAEGRAARQEQDKVRRESIVKDAVKEGRISPASAADWLASLEQDEPRTVALIGSLAKNTIPVVETGVNDELDPENSLYALAWGDDEKGA